MKGHIHSPCHLVLSTRRVLANVLTILLQCFLSAVTSLSFLLGRSLLLLPSTYASIILFSSSSDRITCPKNPSFGAVHKVRHARGGEGVREGVTYFRRSRDV